MPGRPRKQLQRVIDLSNDLHDLRERIEDEAPRWVTKARDSATDDRSAAWTELLALLADCDYAACRLVDVYEARVPGRTAAKCGDAADGDTATGYPSAGAAAAS